LLLNFVIEFKNEGYERLNPLSCLHGFTASVYLFGLMFCPDTEIHKQKS